MSDINIFIVQSPEEIRKNLKKLMPESMRKQFDKQGLNVEMESGEQLNEKLPPGMPKAFVVPEEVLTFPSEPGELESNRNRRRRIRDLNLKTRRERLPGNTEA